MWNAECGMYVGASGSERTLLEIPHSALRIPHLHQAASRKPATSSAVPRDVTFAPGTMRRNSPASTFPGPTSMKRASAPASSAARCMQVTHRTGAVSWSASRRRARVASRTGSAVALAITGNAGFWNGACSSATRRWFAAGAMRDEWNAPLTLSGTTRLAPRALRSEEHTSELQSQSNLVCRLLLEKKKTQERVPRAPLRLNLHLEHHLQC